MTPHVCAVTKALSALPRPTKSFASDNTAGVHQRIINALVRANEGFQSAYGYDEFNPPADAAFDDLFGRRVAAFYTWGGTGANVMALADLVRPGEAVVCTDIAHINVDETGAPERMAGAKLLANANVDGKLVPEHVHAHAQLLGSEHAAQAAVVSITQTTELGTVYSPDEVAALVDAAHQYDMTVHMDGARIANATASLGGTVEALRSFTVDAGVDVISFGGTKNGLMYGEAVIYLDPDRAKRVKFVRKAMGQLPSKMRFIAAQFHELIHDGLWLANATHANASMQRLATACAGAVGVTLSAPQANATFPVLSDDLMLPLCEWTGVGAWNEAINQVRWMTSWATDDDDVDRFAAGVRAAAAAVAVAAAAG